MRIGVKGLRKEIIMEITDKRTDPVVEFGTLEVADVFLYMGEAFIKILPVNRSFTGMVHVS